jgi:glucose-6-phosphate isomerase|tara:strand:- start:1013 stop:2167 length:1155 start_codon:yes stop_codon:yes gene_type:complete
MKKKNSFFKDSFTLTINYYKNVQKTKNEYNIFLNDFKKFKIPLLESYEKNYEYDFSKETVKRFSKCKNIILIGMGGSILGAKSIYSFLRHKIKKKVFFFDNLDFNLHLRYKKIKNLKDSCYVVISKSGNTLETVANLKSIPKKFLLKNKLIIITELKDSNLISIANKFDAGIIEYNNLIEGRYSVLSEAGMFPASLMGLSIDKFKNLNKYFADKKFIASLVNNVAAILTLNQQGFKNSVFLNYDSKLNDLCFWQQQLMGESLGKEGKGITPLVSPCPKDNHSLMQLYLDGSKDKFFTFLSSTANQNNKIESILEVQCKATKNIFKRKKIPFRHLFFKKNDEETLGLAFTFFVLETILLARLMKVNPFDQPAVEQIKIETKKLLR